MGTVLVVVAVLAAIGLTSGSSTRAGEAVKPASKQVLDAVTGLPAASLAAVGAGSASLATVHTGSGGLVAGGKPLVLYIGAEYCPYCAAERWPLIQALSRFGTFTGLGATRSGAADVFPSTPTFTFRGSSYRSPYLVFEGHELFGNTLKHGRYNRLDSLSPAQQSLFMAHGGGFPFLDVGGRYLIAGATFDPGVLAGEQWQGIAESLAIPTSPIARGVAGSANLLTAMICQTTKGQPANVCTAPGVVAAGQRLGG